MFYFWWRCLSFFSLAFFLPTTGYWRVLQVPVVQSVVSLTSSLRVISLPVLADSIRNILIFFAEKMWVAFALHCKSYSHFFSKKFQHICIWPDINFNESLTNDIVSFEQLGPGRFSLKLKKKKKKCQTV